MDRRRDCERFKYVVRSVMWSGIYCGLLLVLAPGAWGQELSLNQAQQQGVLLRRERPPYRNFAFTPFTNYPDHTWMSPASARDGLGVDRPHAFWSPTGDYLMTGYDLFTWGERRQPGQRSGSALFKDWAGWAQVFDHMAVAGDGYGGWGYSVIVGDGLIARFTPLTLSKTDFYGARLDVALPYLKFTALGSRIARPNRDNFGRPALNLGQIEVDLSTLLVGGRAQADLGALCIGVNGVNLHAYDSTRPDNSIKGQLRVDQPLYERLIVRFSDDAPTDGRGGAVIQEVQLMVNGQARPDLRAQVIRHRADVPSQVGRILTTGAFLPKQYNRVTPGDSDSGEIRYYREREVPLYADYFYRLEHETGEDVSKSTHLEGLLANFALETPAEVHRVDGEEELVYLFDLSQEPYVESVEVEAVVGNDYRVEWAGIHLRSRSATSAKFEERFRSTFYRTALRARGRVEDGSNLRRVRFEVGENTAIFTYSADLHLALPWLEVSGEYARSAVYGRYPAHMEGDFLPTASPRFAHRGAAYFANATHWFGRGRVGVEYFSMNPDFTTEMQTFLPTDSGYVTEGGPGYSPYSGLTNNTMIWRLVQDNEDGDRWPDFSVGNILGSPVIQEGQAALPRDGDGVFPGQDADKDGIVDTDRNFNATPDYEETFLMYEVEPNEYAYGLDRNHNDEPDHREDDWEPDYPYDADQGGYHLFGQVDLSRHWSLGVGRYAVKGLASGGRNRSLYALLSYRREGIGRRLFFDHHFRRVEDDIPDEFTEFDRENRFVNISNDVYSGLVVVEAEWKPEELPLAVAVKTHTSTTGGKNMHPLHYRQKRELVAGRVVLGIDPGKKRHTAWMLDTDGLPRGRAFSFSVDHHGFEEVLWQEVATRLAEYGPEQLVIAVETACNLWKTIASYAHQQGYTVILVSPLTTHHARPLCDHDFSRTDPKDAFLVADQARQGRFDLFQVFDAEIEAMRQLSLAYHKLAKDKQRQRQRLRAFMEQYFPEYLNAFDIESQTSLYLLERYFLPQHFQTLDVEAEARVIAPMSRQQHGVETLLWLQEWANESIGVAAASQEESLRLVLDGWLVQLRVLQAQIKKLRKALIERAARHRAFAILTSIPNISEWLAALFIAECRGLDATTHYKQIEKFAGLKLKVVNSGEFVGQRRISYIGNKRLRKVIYQMTQQTAKAVPQVRCRFLRRQLNQACYRKNIVAASAPLLKLIHALVKQQRPYRPHAKWNKQLMELEKAYTQKKTKQRTRRPPETRRQAA